MNSSAVIFSVKEASSKNKESPCWVPPHFLQIRSHRALHSTLGTPLVSIPLPLWQILGHQKEKLPLRQRTSKDTRERLLSVNSVTSPIVDEGASYTGGRISNVVEVRDVMYVGDSYDSGFPS